MKHEPYRSWLLADEPLAAERRSALQSHLEQCDSCRRLRAGWNQVRARLTEASELPAPVGFTDRFKARLRAEHEAGQRRQVWTLFVLTMLGSVVAMGLLLAAVVPNVGSASVGLLKEVFTLRSQVTVIGDFLLRRVEGLPIPAGDLLGVSLLVATLGAAMALYASLGALWTAAVYRFASPTSRNGGSR